MKFLHVSDLHLGRTLGDFDLTEDQCFALGEIVNIAGEKAVDAVLIAGDIYDRAIPNENATRVFDRFLTQLCERGIKVFAVAGNHDSDARVSYGVSLFEKSGVYLSREYDGNLSVISLEDSWGKIDVCLMPFIKASQVRAFYPDEEIRNYSDAVTCALSHAGIASSERAVLVAHQFVTAGGEDPDTKETDSACVKNVGLVEKVDSSCFDAFDYVALGHIHSAQHVGRKEVAYSGSLLKYSRSEVDGSKSVTLVEVREKGSVTVERVPVKPLRDVIYLKGKLEEIIGGKLPKCSEDYVYVTLTDEESVDDAISIIQQYYPRAVKLDYDNSSTRELNLENFDISVSQKSFEELIRGFFREVYGREMSEAEYAVMLEAAEEAGVEA